MDLQPEPAGANAGAPPVPAISRSAAIAQLWTTIFLAGALATLAVPVLLVAIPPLLDYPNHLVRLWLIAGGAENPPLAKMYAVSWGSAHTNVGIDYLGALLGRLIPAVPLGSFFVVLALVLPPLGALALHRAVFGGLHWCQIGFLFFAWNATLLAGFLNFHIGVGLALLGAALEPRLAHTSPLARLCARLATGALVLIVHFFALFYYCALLAGLAFGRDSIAFGNWRALAARATAAIPAAGSAAIPAVVFVVLSPSLPGAHVDALGNAPLWDFSAYNKGHVLLSPIVTYALWLDVLLAGAIAAPVLWAMLVGRLEAHAGLVLTAGALIALALAAPTAVSGTWWIDNRFPLMALLALLAGLRPGLELSSAARLAMAALLALVVTGRTAWIGSIWKQRQADIGAVYQAVRQVPPGSAVLPLDHIDDAAGAAAHPLGRYFHNGHPAHWSYSVLVIMWRQAFVPNLFWAAGKQPLRVLPPWDQISFPEDGLLPAVALADPSQTPTHFRAWRQRYDYVLLLNADVGKGVDLSALPELRLERDEGFARLYRIAKAVPTN